MTYSLRNIHPQYLDRNDLPESNRQMCVERLRQSHRRHHYRNCMRLSNFLLSSLLQQTCLYRRTFPQLQDLCLQTWLLMCKSLQQQCSHHLVQHDLQEFHPQNPLQIEPTPEGLGFHLLLKQEVGPTLKQRQVPTVDAYTPIYSSHLN